MGRRGETETGRDKETDTNTDRETETERENVVIVRCNRIVLFFVY